MRIARKDTLMQPIQLGLFTLTENGLTVEGKPTFAEYEACGEFIRRANAAAGWWLVDWLAYSDTRPDWQEQAENLVDSGVYAEGTVRQYRYLGKALPPDQRVEGVTFGHHAVVASCEPELRTELLERSKVEGWTRGELQKQKRIAERPTIIQGQAALEGTFRVIYADPPWAYRSNQSPDGTRALGKAENHYPTMSIADICKLPVAAHTQRDAVLFLWVPAPMLLTNPGPREVLEAWGFTYKTGAVWDKVLGNFGHYFHVTHEHLLVCTRGSCLPDVPTPMTKSVITIRREREHSKKPDDVRRIIEKHWTRGPYLELFGRKRIPGWAVFGNDARLWPAQSQEAE